MAVGKVYLVGAGPGDPDLLTVRAADLLAAADVVVHDRLVPPLALLPIKPGARLIDVGKEPTLHRRPQDQINQILVDEGLAGNQVVRLKGGDGFVFGRGGEEALALVAAGVPFEVVPGITSSIAAPAYAGIPVTHRGISTEFAVVTGHEDPTKEGSTQDWPHLARGVGTLVLLMGVKNLGVIVERLLEHGRNPATPAAIIQRGCWGAQRVLETTLAELPHAPGIETFTPPSITVIGDVVALRGRIGAWWENLPLHGRRFLVTRPAADARPLARRLVRLGADVAVSPLVETRPLPSPQGLDEALDSLGTSQWLILTSRNGVAVFFDALSRRGLDARALAGLRVAAIGPATAESLADRGIRADLVPACYTGEGLLQAFDGQDMTGSRVLLPRAAGARPVLVDGLRSRGAQVVEIHTYETVAAGTLTDEGRELLEGGVDAVLLFSPSAVDALDALLPAGDRPAVAAVGPITGDRARDLGFRVVVEAPEHTGEGLVEALAAWCAEGSGRSQSL